MFITEAMHQASQLLPPPPPHKKRIQTNPKPDHNKTFTLSYFQCPVGEMQKSQININIYKRERKNYIYLLA